MVGYALEASAPPFPAFVLGYCINGFGMSLQVHYPSSVLSEWLTSPRTQARMGTSAAGNSPPKPRWASCTQYTVRLSQSLDARSAETKNAPGVGALCSPLISTQFAQLPRWSFHYLTSLGVAFINFVFLTLVLRFRTQDGTVGIDRHVRRKR